MACHSSNCYECYPLRFAMTFLTAKSKSQEKDILPRALINLIGRREP